MKIAEYLHEVTKTNSRRYELCAVVRQLHDCGNGSTSSIEQWEEVPTGARVALAQQLLATLTDEERRLVAERRSAELDEMHKVAFLRKRAQTAEESAQYLSQQVTELRDKLEEWKDASGLECGGDPDGVTPGAMRKYWESIEAELARAHKDADMLKERLSRAAGLDGDVSIGVLVGRVRDNERELQAAKKEASEAGWLQLVDSLPSWIAELRDKAGSAGRLAASAALERYNKESLLADNDRLSAELRDTQSKLDRLRERLAVVSGIGGGDDSIEAIMSLVRNERLLLQTVRRVARDAGWLPSEPLDVWIARMDNALAGERLAVETERLSSETERALSDSLKASHDGVHKALREVIEAAQAEGWDQEEEDLPAWIRRIFSTGKDLRDVSDYADLLEANLNDVRENLGSVSSAASAGGWDGVEGLSGWIRRRCGNEKSEAKRLLEKLVEATKRIAEEGA